MVCVAYLKYSQYRVSLEYQADAELNEERRETLEALPDSLLRLTDAFDRVLAVLNDEALTSSSSSSSSASSSDAANSSSSSTKPAFTSTTTSAPSSSSMSTPTSTSTSVRLEALDASVFAPGQLLPFLLDALRLEATESAANCTAIATGNAIPNAAGDDSTRLKSRTQSGHSSHSTGAAASASAGDAGASPSGASPSGAEAARAQNEEEMEALRLRALTLETECEATRAQLEQTVRRLQALDQEKRQWSLEQMLSQRRLEMQIEVCAMLRTLLHVSHVI